jgi:hypothetical protein
MASIGGTPAGERDDLVRHAPVGARRIAGVGAGDDLDAHPPRLAHHLAGDRRHGAAESDHFDQAVRIFS